MPTYEYRCNGCGKVEEKFHSITEVLDLYCDKCGCKEPMVRIISYNPTGFVFKGGTTTIHQREKDRRKKKAVEIDARMRRNRSSLKVKPNIAGVQTESWSDAQKMAKEAGLNHESYTPFVEKEKKSKKIKVVSK